MYPTETFPDTLPAGLDAEAIRGRCPECRGWLVSEFARDDERDCYLIRWRCVGSKKRGACRYVRVL